MELAERSLSAGSTGAIGASAGGSVAIEASYGSDLSSFLHAHWYALIVSPKANWEPPKASPNLRPQPLKNILVEVSAFAASQEDQHHQPQP